MYIRMQLQSHWICRTGSIGPSQRREPSDFEEDEVQLPPYDIVCLRLERTRWEIEKAPLEDTSRSSLDIEIETVSMGLFA
jgi:hypothetical protein